MDIRRKMLSVAMIMMFVENTNGMTSVNGIITALPPIIAQMQVPAHNQNQLDFNSIVNNGANIPSSYQPKIYRTPTIGAPNTACVYFTVTNNGNPNNTNHVFQNAVIENPVPTNECNIYFPMDGHQPTTPEAVAWSCANVEDDAITDWYMKMFGVIPFQNVGAPNPNGYIKAGWDNIPAFAVAQRIMTFTNLVNSQLRRFENIFRIIAANKIGRLLLYRILLEIRRHDAAGNGICEPGIMLLANRNFHRSVIINWADYFSLSSGHRGTGTILPSNTIINFNDKVIFTNAVFSRWPTLGYHKVDRCCRTPEIGLFHEMVHWFHMLRDPNRSVQECKAYMVAGGGGMIAPVNLIGSRRQETIGSYFWGGLKDNTRNSIKVSAIPWVEDKEINNVSKRRAKVINFEDIRTILGAPNLAKFREVVPLPHHMNRFKYLEGDDLSENSFRVSLGMPIRLGHTNMDFYEDYKVVDRALEIAGGNSRNNLLNDQKGLGNLYIRDYNNYVLDSFFAN